MKENDEEQNRRWIKHGLIVFGLFFGLLFSGSHSAQAARLESVYRNSLCFSEERVEVPEKKGSQFRAKLLRKWWQTKSPKYLIYRSLFWSGK